MTYGGCHVWDPPPPLSGKKWNFLDKWADNLQDQTAGPVSLVPWSPSASLLTVHLLADV